MCMSSLVGKACLAELCSFRAGAVHSYGPLEHD